MKVVSSFWSKLQGKKTYLLALAGAVLWLGWILGWWTMAEVDQLFALLAVLGVMAVRSAISK